MLRFPPSLLVLAITASLTSACGGDDAKPATTSVQDAVVADATAETSPADVDSPSTDAGGGAETLGADAGAVPDAGPMDVGQGSDAGQTVDAGQPEDAGQPVDAGPPVDAGQTVDAGQPEDAVQPEDAGQPEDTGPSEDAGSPDAGADAAPVCVPTQPSLEVCDGIDNDCDGQTDAAVNCDDGNPCTTGACAAVQGKTQCAQTPVANGAPCDDGNACSASSACEAGFCKGDTACNDGLACTADSCDPLAGCSHAANDTLCDDGNVCTSQACEPGKGCTTAPAAGACNDGSACTQSDACDGGVCKGSDPLNCDDGNTCTDDACDAKTGCKHTANTATCDDGNACSVGEACAASTCKGGNPKCDDGNVCTLDACDPSGTCSHTAIAGCKVCTVATDCNDNKACTTDTCAAGKCAWTPIAGCVGETDYTLTNFTSNKASFTTGELVNFNVSVTNLGKAWPGGAIAKLKWEVWFSVDDKIDPTDALVHTKTWSSFNIGGPTNVSASEGSTWTSAQPAHWYHKFQCVRLVYSADANTADNDKCIPVTVLDGEVGLKSVVATGSKLKASHYSGANPTSTLVLETDNPGTKAIQPLTSIFLSQDGTWDASDKLIGSNVKPTVAMGKNTTTLTFPTYQFQSTITGKVWVCVRSNLDLVSFEKTSDDNTVCGQVEVENPAELVLGDPFAPSDYLTFSGTTNASTVAYGAAAACKKSVYNIGLGKVVGGFKSRCFLSTTEQVADAGWLVEWQHTGDLPSGTLNCAGGYSCGLKLDLTSPAGPPVTPPAVGPSKLCVEVNTDKAVLEANYTDNKFCVPVTVVGGNVQVNTKLTASNNGQPLVLKQGVAYSDTFAVSNVGNADLAGVDGKFLGRILLSTDNKLSADDVKLWEGVQTGFNVYTKPAGTLVTSYGLPTSTTKPSVTVPVGTTPGAYFLLYVVNADGLFAEPQGDNVYAKPATVQ